MKRIDRLRKKVKESEKYSKPTLKSYKKSGVMAVEILPASDACDICKAWKGKKIPLKEALKKPPLPIKDCQKDIGCRCCYIPVI